MPRAKLQEQARNLPGALEDFQNHTAVKCSQPVSIGHESVCERAGTQQAELLAQAQLRKMATQRLREVPPHAEAWWKSLRGFDEVLEVFGNGCSGFGMCIASMA